MAHGTCAFLFLVGLISCSFTPRDEHWIQTESGEFVVSSEELKTLLMAEEGVLDKSFLENHVLSRFSGRQPTIPSNCSRIELVESVIDLLDINFLYHQIDALSSFWNRFYTSKYGVDAAESIYSKYESIIASSFSESKLSVKFFNHTWPQPSVIASIEGVGENKEEIVIVGAHLDSVNWQAENQDVSRAPGACDNGSGSATVMELFRVILESGLSFNRTLEFHHYAAEEVGLLGSIDVANDYAKKEKLVAGYLNFDMNGYPGNPGFFNIVTDYSAPDLNQFFFQLIDTYSLMSYSTFDCGYGCSDHASWYEANYRSSYAIENGPFYQGHTSDDNLVYLFMPYILEYCKVGLGFLIEIGTWQ